MTAQSTVLHVPSLAAAVTGDLAYKVHMMTAETVDPERAQCPRRRDLHRPGSRRPRPVPAHTDEFTVEDPLSGLIGSDDAVIADAQAEILTYLASFNDKNLAVDMRPEDSASHATNTPLSLAAPAAGWLSAGSPTQLTPGRTTALTASPRGTPPWPCATCSLPRPPAP
jgi:hypothetical protein